MDNYKVYVHVNKINGKLYIGLTKSKNPNRRWENGNGYRNNILFNRAIQKYGWDSFEHIVLFENISKEIASIAEQELIKKYKTNNSKYGYNICSGGINGFTVAESTKEKLREKSSGEKSYWYGVKGEYHPRYGKKMSQEAIEAIREKNKKENWTEETKIKKVAASKKQSIRQKGKMPKNAIIKAAEYHRGRKMSDEQKKKISETLKQHPPMIGVKMSEESKEKMSKVRKERGIFKDTKNPSARAVVQLDKDTLEYITEYECMKFASEATGANEHNICSCCKGKIKSSGGYKWMYREEYYDKGVDENLWKAKK